MTASNAINATVYDNLNYDFIRAVTADDDPHLRFDCGADFEINAVLADAN